MRADICWLCSNMALHHQHHHLRTVSSLRENMYSGEIASVRLSRYARMCLSRSITTGQPSADAGDESNSSQLTQRQRLKLAVRDYGTTVIVFHISVALCSLACFYTAVSCGVDVLSGLRLVGVSEQWTSSVARAALAEGTTFVIAYAVHKLFAPLRIGLTLTCSPLLVTFLRRKGVLSSRQSSSSSSSSSSSQK